MRDAISEKGDEQLPTWMKIASGSTIFKEEDEKCHNGSPIHVIDNSGTIMDKNFVDSKKRSATTGECRYTETTMKLLERSRALSDSIQYTRPLHRK